MSVTFVLQDLLKSIKEISKACCVCHPLYYPKPHPFPALFNKGNGRLVLKLCIVFHSLPGLPHVA